MRYKSINQLLFSCLLLVLGVVLLLVNIGVISLEIKQLFVTSYPFLLIIVGVSSIINRLLSKKKENLFGSLFLTSFSFLLILDRLDFIHFRFVDIWKLWPFFIIWVGLSLLFKKETIKITVEKDVPGTLLESNKNDFTFNGQGKKKVKAFSIGDINFKDSNWSLEPLQLYNTIGDYFIDFSKAYIPDKETPILVHGWIGDVKMIVPEDIPVLIQTKIKVGDIRIFELKSEDINREIYYKTPGFDDATRKLHIKIELKMGSIRIDRV